MTDNSPDIYSLLEQLELRQRELLRKLGDKCSGNKINNVEEVEYSALVQKIFILKMELLKRKGTTPH